MKLSLLLLFWVTAVPALGAASCPKIEGFRGASEESRVFAVREQCLSLERDFRFLRKEWDESFRKFRQDVKRAREKKDTAAIRAVETTATFFAKDYSGRLFAPLQSTRKAAQEILPREEKESKPIPEFDPPDASAADPVVVAVQNATKEIRTAQAKRAGELKALRLHLEGLAAEIEETNRQWRKKADCLKKAEPGSAECLED